MRSEDLKLSQDVTSRGQRLVLDKAHREINLLALPYLKNTMFIVPLTFVDAWVVGALRFVNGDNGGAGQS
ncbi:MAG: hypothetical protein COB56_02445 [Robiginitomaculum sp.]|nr:MAG: hypothetical protein COB56_02445 [Robiginitomaculum sp.]